MKFGQPRSQSVSYRPLERAFQGKRRDPGHEVDVWLTLTNVCSPLKVVKVGSAESLFLTDLLPFIGVLLPFIVWASRLCSDINEVRYLIEVPFYTFTCNLSQATEYHSLYQDNLKNIIINEVSF